MSTAPNALALTRSITERAIEMLQSYRKHCAPAGSSSGQLILPESLKLLPVYLSALFKTPAFVANKAQHSSGTASGGGRPPFADVAARMDARLASVIALNSLPPAGLVPLIYPRLYMMHRMSGWVR